jgi:hypothetical protein
MKAEFRIALISLIMVVTSLGIGTATSDGASPSPTPSHSARQSQIHKVGQQIMNFDLTNSKHIFSSTATGGKLTVLAKTSSTNLIHDIRIHLGLVSEGFKVGNYTDPTLIHGASMPGLATLRQDFEKILVTYQEEKAGGTITFFSKIDRDIQAIHIWFAAQLDDHGADATAGTSMDSMITTKAMWARHHPGVPPPSYLKK